MTSNLWPKTLASLSDTEKHQMVVVLLGMLSSHNPQPLDTLFYRAYAIAQRQLRGTE